MEKRFWILVIVLLAIAAVFSTWDADKTGKVVRSQRDMTIPEAMVAPSSSGDGGTGITQQSGPITVLGDYFNNRFANLPYPLRFGVDADHHLHYYAPPWREAEIREIFRRWTSVSNPSLSGAFLVGDHGGGCGVGGAGSGCPVPSPVNKQMRDYRALMDQFSTLPPIIAQMGGHEKLDSALVGPIDWYQLAFNPGLPVGTGTGRSVYWYYSFNMGPDARAYVLDANYYGSSVVGEQIPQEQLDWLERELYQHREDAYLFVHEPIAYDDGLNAAPASSLRCTTTPCNNIRVLELFEQFPNIKAIFQGHKHIIYPPQQPRMKLQDKYFINVFTLNTNSGDYAVLEILGRNNFKLATIQPLGGVLRDIDLQNVRDFGYYPSPRGIKKYGFSTPSCQGSIAIGATEIPSSGSRTFAITVKKAPQNTNGWLLIGSQKWDPGVSFLGIDILVDISSLGFVLLPITSDSGGGARMTVPVSLPIGTRIYTQMIWANTATCGSVGTLSASNGMEITVQS